LRNSGSELVEEGDYVVLFLDERRSWVVRVEASRNFHTHKGIVKLGNLVGKRYGEAVQSNLNQRFWVLKPTTYDHMMNVDRPTQIMYPKDIGILILKLGIGPGKIVVEAGTGSGAAAIAIANALKPDGHLYSYETRIEFLRVAERNLRRAGLLDFVTLRNADAKLGFQEHDVDAVAVDLGEPWEIVPQAYRSLKGGCPLASFSPTINQVERTVLALRENNFIDLQTIECLVRNMRVEKGKTRPTTMMLGHTGYLTFARKILGTSTEAAD